VEQQARDSEEEEDRGWILVYAEAASEPVRGLGSAARSGSTEASQVAISTLRANVKEALSGLDTVMNGAPETLGGLALDEVEVHLSVDGKGNVGLAGLLRAELAAGGGIRFVFRKKSS
jgi:hypothetical protein